MNGKLVVFEGTDGSGKRTQMNLLKDFLVKKNIAHDVLDFPRYGSFFGDLAGKLLAGEFGATIPSQLAVLPFACDRWMTKPDLNAWLRDGKIVVSNRYTGSSAVYHAAKVAEEDQQQFIDWIYRLEQEVIGLPKEDLVLYFHMPVENAQALIDKRGARRDMNEKNMKLLKTVERLYSTLASSHSHWRTIECVQNNKIKTPSEIHKEVLGILGL